MATKTRIGKDVIESLTMGMYEDSRFIYREYIQNSADQIDLATSEGLLSSSDEGYIDIEILAAKRIVSISDNATGIESEKAESLLKDIAKSSKDRKRSKGFRGIGRLGGLGYCESLKFETSFSGEPVKTTLTWDSIQLKKIINDRSKQEDASSVIDAVTEVNREEWKAEDHFFKVTLIGVTNDQLLNKTDIMEYLAMVAPVPFDKGFIYKGEILAKASESGHNIDVYNVYVNTDQIFKAYTSTIYTGEGNSRKRLSEIIEIQSFELGKNVWGWYSISDNPTQQIPAKANIGRGMRLRKGNIQIGGDSSLSKFFTEERFNYYFFGEVHVFDSQLIPNARRDYFIENDAFFEFEENVGQYFSKELSKLVRFASAIKSASTPIKKFADFSHVVEEKQKEKGFSDKDDERRHLDELEELREKAEKAESDLTRQADQLDLTSSKGKIFNHLTEGLGKKVDEIQVDKTATTKFITDSLSKLDRKERKLVSKVFSVIDQVLPKELAENLKEKIKEGFQ